MTKKINKFKKQSGFTMIELLVVIVIIGILSTIGLGSFTSSQQKARDSRRKTDLRAIGDALELYYNDFGSYPIDDGTGNFIGCGVGAQTTACSAGQIWQNSDNGTTYMVQVPEDPNGGKYFYVSATGASYQIYAHLENDRDRDVPIDGSGDPTYYTTPTGTTCVTGSCNYGRSSTNINLGATF